MATSARDLLLLARDHVNRGVHPTPDEAESAITAASALGRRLAEMYSAEAELRIGRDAPWIEIRRLIDACDAAGAAWPRRAGRLPDLVGTACDVIGRHDRMLTRDERWTVAVELNEAVRRCTELAMRPDAFARLPTLQRVRDASIAVAREAARRPSICGASVLDLLVPAGTESEIAHQDSILDRLARLAQAIRLESRGRPPSVAAALAVASACESLAQACASYAPSCSAEAAIWRAAPASWSVVSAALVRFHDGSGRPDATPSGIIESAIGVQRAAARMSTGDRDCSATPVANAASHLPRFATYLEIAAGQWHREQLVFAKARDLVRRDELVEAILSKKAVPIGAVDAATLVETLRVAGRLSQVLAGEIDPRTDRLHRAPAALDRRTNGDVETRSLDEDIRWVTRVMARTSACRGTTSVAI